MWPHRLLGQQRQHTTPLPPNECRYELLLLSPLRLPRPPQPLSLRSLSLRRRRSPSGQAQAARRPLLGVQALAAKRLAAARRPLAPSPKPLPLRCGVACTCSPNMCYEWIIGFLTSCEADMHACLSWVPVCSLWLPSPLPRLPPRPLLPLPCPAARPAAAAWSAASLAPPLALWQRSLWR